ncbi:MAG: transposase [Pyrinomonadaceae bacterium]|nr:transposase [Pyrinomonadaceae bacterium]
MNPHEYPNRWHSRGRLPHFEGGEIFLQFVTFRLFDSIPPSKIRKWQLELESEETTDAQREIAIRIEKHLDRGYGNAFLKNRKVAEIVENSLLHWDGKKYKLFAWVIMPNHVYLLLRPKKGFALAEIMHSIKSFTANKANELLNRQGDFWQHESFDRFIRNHEHFMRVVGYIENNPVKAGLCLEPSEWRYSSAYYFQT